MSKLICIFLISIGSLNLTAPGIGYDFSKPVLKDVLPESLHEISGLAIIDSTTIACIQDENGILFFYDIKLHKIKREFTFGLDGDYEGITLVDKVLYILRSDGVLFEIKDYATKKPSIKTYATQIPALNNEGLCYDVANNRLLIGAKGRINKDPQFRDQRIIYAFDLKTKSLNSKPLFNLNINDINLSSKLSGANLPKKKDKKGNVYETGFKFNTSEIAIHPITKQLYVLSATDHCLFIFNMNGTLENTKQLDPILFNKSEGLSFFLNGDLIISNEGQAHEPTLLRFNYIP